MFDYQQRAISNEAKDNHDDIFAQDICIRCAECLSFVLATDRECWNCNEKVKEELTEE